MTVEDKERTARESAVRDEEEERRRLAGEENAAFSGENQK